MKKDIKDILVVRFSSLGDLVLITGVIKYIKTNINSDLNIDVLTMSNFSEVLNNNPYIRNVYTIPKGAKVSVLNDKIASMPDYDAVVDLHKNTRSFLTKLILSCKSYTYNKNSIARRQFVKNRIFKFRLKKHVVEKYFEPFAKLLNIKETPSLEELRPFITPIINKDFINSKKKKIVTIHPFASKQTKVWPFFPKLISSLIEDGVDVIVIGIGEIENLNPKAINKTGPLSLDVINNIISSSDAFVSTDSGPMHIGVALNIPTIAIFGPTTKELGFYPDFKNVKVIENIDLKCRPCHIHGSNSCPKKHFKCMIDIGSEEIRFHVNSILNINH